MAVHWMQMRASLINDGDFLITSKYDRKGSLDNIFENNQSTDS